MAINRAAVIGDSCEIIVEVTSPDGVDPMEFVVGAFRSQPEERRVVLLHMSAEAGTKPLQLRLEFTSPIFIEHSITGDKYYKDTKQVDGLNL